MTEPKRILALDPATFCGYAHTNGDYGIWRLKHGATEHAGNRLVRLRNNILRFAETDGIDLLAFEDSSFGSRHKNVIMFHGQMRGVILSCASELHIPWETYKPKEIKKFATDNGNATKRQMMEACERHFCIWPETSDVADAMFILAMAKQNYHSTPTKKKPKPRRKRTKEQQLF